MDWLLVLATDPAAQPELGRLMGLVVEYSYIGVFLFLIACGLGFPSPEEVALIGGGYAIYQAGGGWPEALAMVAVAMTGVLVGDSLLWILGRKVGHRPERLPLIGRHLNPARMEKARALFARHGAKAVFFGRFLFGIRAVTFFVSGSLRVPLSTFLLMDGLAGMLSVPPSILLAWHFGAELEEGLQWIGKFHRVLFLLLGIVAAFIAFRMWRAWRARHPGPRGPGDGVALDVPATVRDAQPATASGEGGSPDVAGTGAG